MIDDLTIRTATPGDLSWAHALRHEVYAEELGQHDVRPEGRLSDALDGGNVYLVATRGDEPIGFVSVTPPWLGRFGLDKYVTRVELPLLDEPDVFEVRILTVRADERRTGVATALMYAAMRWVASPAPGACSTGSTRCSSRSPSCCCCPEPLDARVPGDTNGPDSRRESPGRPGPISCSRWCCRSPRTRGRSRRDASSCRRSCTAGCRPRRR